MLDQIAVETLIELLEERLSVIGDHKRRDHDPAEHLAALQTASEAIVAFHEVNRSEIPPRLNHFLSNCSFDKALDWCREASGS